MPARKLERSFDLRSLFFEEYFEDAPNGHSLSEVLENLVLAHERVDSENQLTNSIRILLILDGLDEVTRYSQRRHALLERLMKGTAVIITSRFHDINMPYAPIDLHLEALGLSIMNVDAYLDNSMFIAEDSARQIRHFIEASALVKDMIRVPIHLDIVCYGWDQLHVHNNAFNAIMDEGETSTPTMATLYQSVVRSLWRQDVPDLGKMDHGERMTAETINAVQDIARLDRLVNTENDLLEELAINMLESDRIEFTSQDVANVIQHWESNGNQILLSLESKIRKFSLLRSNSRDGYRTFRFVHLTFQDFFAARYIVRSLVQEPSRLRSLLRRYKHNRRYELFWRFIPGLLTKVEDLHLFFQLLDQEPRDMLGIQHIQLVMHCWHEWPARLKSRSWEELVKRMEDWQELEWRMSKWDCIGSSMVFPEHILARKLESGISKTLEIDSNVLRTICNRISLSEDLIRSAIQLIVDHRLFGYWPIRAFEMPLSLGFMDDMQKEPTNFYFLWQVGQKIRLPESSISFLMREIRENTSLTPSDLPYNARRILMDQRTLPDDVMEELDGWFRSEEPPLARIASSILSQQVTLSKKTIDHAVEQMIRESGGHGLGEKYRWIVKRDDLPRETVARILAWLLQKGRMAPNFDYPTVRLHPDNVKEMGMLLDMCLHHDQVQEKDFDSLWCIPDPQATDDPKARAPLIEIKRMTRFALHFLLHQPSLPTKILKTVVRILHWNLNQFKIDNQIRDGAYHILQGQRELHDDVIVELRDMFNKNGEETVVAALRGRLHLFDEAYRWALASATYHLRPQTWKSQHGPEYLRKILEVLSDEPDLPENFVDNLVHSFPKMLEEQIISFRTPAFLLSRQRNLSKGAVDGMVQVLKSTDRWVFQSSNEVPQLYKRQAFAEPLVDALCEASDKVHVENLVYALDFQDLDQKSTGRLRELLDSGSAFLGPCVERVHRLLFRQAEHDRGSISNFQNVTSEEGIPFLQLWYTRHLEQFAISLETIEPYIIDKILPILLHRSAEDITPVYINGNTVHYQAADGKMKKLLLKDEKSFRRMFRKAQRLVGFPDWSCVNQFPKERKLQIPVVNRVSTSKESKSKIPFAKRVHTSK